MAQVKLGHPTAVVPTGMERGRTDTFESEEIQAGRRGKSLVIVSSLITGAVSFWTGVGLLFSLGHGEHSPLYNDDADWSDVRFFVMVLALPAAATFFAARRYRPESVVFAVALTAATALWAWVLAVLILLLFPNGQ